MTRGRSRTAHRAAAAAATAAVLLLAPATANADVSQDVTVIAGVTLGGFYSDDVPGPITGLRLPGGLAAAPDGSLYFTEQAGGRVRRIAPDGTVTGVAGAPNATGGFAGDGGPAASAQLQFPDGVAADSHGNVFVADTGNQRIRKIGPDGIITTVAGSGIAAFDGDGGPATAASLSRPTALAVDRFDNLYIADAGNNRIRKVDAGGTITTFAGNGGATFTPTGDGGQADAAPLAGPGALAVTPDYLYFAEHADIRKVGLADHVLSTVAGTGEATYLQPRGDDGPALAATLNQPYGVGADSHGNVFIADAGNRIIRQITPDGIIHFVVSVDPGQLAVDNQDGVYFVDAGRSLILKLGQVKVAAKQALPLPSNHTCTSRRAFPIRVRRYRGISYVSATVALNGRRVPVYVYTTRRLRMTKVGAVYLNRQRFRAFVDLRGRAKGTYKVKVTATTTDGRTLAATRTYHTCAGSGRLSGGIPRL